MLLVTKDLTTGYSQKKEQVIIHEQLNISLPEGKMVALIGPNGSGKSTLLRTIAGLQKPLSGSVLVDGKNLFSCNNAEKSTLISLVLTDRIEAGYLSVEQVISFGRYPYTGWGGNLSPADWDRIEQAIILCHLERLAKKPFSQLSDGEKQRTMIARAIAQDTPIVVLDEPTAHLDLSYRVEILSLLKQLSRNTNKSIVVATHELDLAMHLADQLWLMPAQHQFFSNIPEELALNGNISDSFNSALVQFDEWSGTFRINRHPTKFIKLTGAGPRAVWTQKALEREGFGIDKKSETEVVLTEEAWCINNETVLTLTALISKAKEMLNEQA